MYRLHTYRCICLIWRGQGLWRTLKITRHLRQSYVNGNEESTWTESIGSTSLHLRSHEVNNARNVLINFVLEFMAYLRWSKLSVVVFVEPIYHVEDRMVTAFARADNEWSWVNDCLLLRKAITVVLGLWVIGHWFQLRLTLCSYISSIYEKSRSITNFLLISQRSDDQTGPDVHVFIWALTGFGCLREDETVWGCAGAESGRSTGIESSV
jgi:hypothetical protein